MTVQFKVEWNGYDAGGVYTLSAPEETRLIAAGIAFNYVPVPQVQGGLTSAQLAAGAVAPAAVSSTGSILGADGSPVSGASTVKAPRHGLMRWQGHPINQYGGTMSLSANAWFGATFRSPVPIMAARIALRVGSGGAAGATAYQAAYLQPLDVALPTSWPYQINAGDGSSTVNIHSGSGIGNFTFGGAQQVGIYASTGALETAFPAASNAGKTGLVGAAAPYAQYVSNGTSWVATGASGDNFDDSAYPSLVSGLGAAGVSSPAGSTLSSGAVASLFWSDWLNLRVAPIQAADGYYYYGVAVQNSATNTIPALTPTAGKVKALLADSTYAAAKCLQLVDTYPLTNSGAFANWAVATGQSLARAASGYYETSPVAALEVLTPARVMQVAAICDSQLGGFATGVTGATMDAYGALKRACMAASSLTGLVQFVDTSLPAVDFTGQVQTWMAGLEQIAPSAQGRGQSSLMTGIWRPDVLFIQPSSANDNSNAPTCATIRMGFGKALRIAELCRRNRITPVLCTIPPAGTRYSLTTTGGDMSVENCRRQINGMIRASATGSGMLLLDTDLIVADNSGSRSIIQAAFDGGDGTHFSDAGNAAISTAAKAIIDSLV
jgi:hypothetical protein